MSYYTELGLEENDAKISALMTTIMISTFVNLFSRSDYQIARNYLLLEIFGKEKAEELHDSFNNKGTEEIVQILKLAISKKNLWQSPIFP